MINRIVRYTLLSFLAVYFFSMCVGCSVRFRDGVQDEKVMWYFVEYLTRTRDNRPEELTEHWLVRGCDHYVDIPGNYRKYKKGDTEFWPAQK